MTFSPSLSLLLFLPRMFTSFCLPPVRLCSQVDEQKDDDIGDDYAEPKEPSPQRSSTVPAVPLRRSEEGATVSRAELNEVMDTLKNVQVMVVGGGCKRF